MARYGQALLDRLEKLIGEAEEKTSAELVVVLASRSEAYPDVPYKAGALLALLTLVLLIFLPVSFRAEWLVVDTVAAFGLGFLAGRASSILARLLSCRRRREAGVQRAAQAVFTARGVSLTRERSGVLLYLSWLEKQVVVLGDIGLDRRIPLDQWERARGQFAAAFGFADPAADFEKGLAALAPVLQKYLPPEKGNPNEIPNRPVVI
jgi:putative membrane protein